MEVVVWASNVLLAIGYFGVPAGAVVAFTCAAMAFPFGEGRRWYGRPLREIWSAWRSGTVSYFEFRVGAPATMLRPAWRSLLVTVPAFLLGLGLGVVAGSVTWAS